MKTTREILEACDAQDIGVVIGRHRRNSWEKAGKEWLCQLQAERDGVKLEISSQFGETFDAALAKAWAKFEPASTAGLPPVPALAAPTPAFEDADLVDDNEAIPF